MPPLSNVARRLFSCLAVLALVLGIATLPLSVRSAASSASIAPHIAAISETTAPPTAVPIHRNPFQSDSSADDEPPRTIAATTATHPFVPAQAGFTLPTVSAVAVGTHPWALLEENGAARIRTIGDRIGSHAIVAISLDGVRLDDGTLLVMSSGTESPAPRADPFPAIPIGPQPLPDVRGDTR